MARRATPEVQDMHPVQVRQLQLLWQPRSGHSIAAGVPAGLLQLVPAQRVAHRVVPCRLWQCDQQLCLHVRHLRPAGIFSSERRLYWRACSPCAHCKRSLTETCAAFTSLQTFNRKAARSIAEEGLLPGSVRGYPAPDLAHDSMLNPSAVRGRPSGSMPVQPALYGGP